ncbi:amidohydrolase family protein [Acidianus sp. HS-5]|uniref:amidohydrolase family protein n=1 Tax=Acidianus sp. HS-5 TaxID=2886040 RepID=UPI001F1CB8B3|nr:amidohydrolase family protein [Acidianus sp. HS-5]BDC19213.1 hypothetical protein HS5_21030 [Acidianus sp. HS-5]
MENCEILNVRKVLLGDNLEIKDNANIEICNGQITHIGNGFASNGKNFTTGIAIPSLVNSHVHILDYAFPEIGIDKALKDLVGDPNSIKYEFLSKLNEKELTNFSLKYIYNSINFGIITIVDFRELGILGSKIALSTKRKIAGINYIILGRLEKNEFSEENLTKLAEIDDGFGVSSMSSYSRQELEKISYAFKNKIRAAHVSETLRQNLKSDLEYFIKYLKPNLVIHGTWLSENEMLLLKDNNISLVFCPRSNLWFSSGIPKIATAIRSGVNILLGTDNAAWISPNLWKEMETALLISRLQDPLSNYSREILRAVTINAKFLGDNKIEEGIKSNFIIIEGDKTGILRAHDTYSAIIKRGSEGSITYVEQPRILA